MKKKSSVNKAGNYTKPNLRKIIFRRLMNSNTYGTAKVDLSDGEIAETIKNMPCFNLKPASIISRLKLKNPIYSETAAYGHMGRNSEEKTVKFWIDGDWKTQTDMMNSVVAGRKELSKIKALRSRNDYQTNGYSSGKALPINKNNHVFDGKVGSIILPNERSLDLDKLMYVSQFDYSKRLQ